MIISVHISNGGKTLRNKLQTTNKFRISSRYLQFTYNCRAIIFHARARDLIVGSFVAEVKSLQEFYYFGNDIKTNVARMKSQLFYRGLCYSYWWDIVIVI